MKYKKFYLILLIIKKIKYLYNKINYYIKDIIYNFIINN